MDYSAFKLVGSGYRSPFPESYSWKCFADTHVNNCLGSSDPFPASRKVVYEPTYIRLPYVPRNCGHIRQVTYSEREK